jgi:hypothetical protein
MAERVSTVIALVGTSTASWEKAAAAIAQACQTLRDEAASPAWSSKTSLSSLPSEGGALAQGRGQRLIRRQVPPPHLPNLPTSSRAARRGNRARERRGLLDGTGGSVVTRTIKWR